MGFKENQTIMEINLEYSVIGAEGAVAISEALKENQTITNISLGFTLKIKLYADL